MIPVTVGLILYIALIFGARWGLRRFLTHGPGGDPFSTFLWHVIRLMMRMIHHARFEGLEKVPPTNGPGAMIVVSNHTGGVDALLIQAACRFEIRWMMASDMMGPSLDWLWKRQQLIAVDRDGKDTGPLREAIRHVKAGGVVGIFPEGRIVKPPGEIRSFHDGVGLLISRTQAPVLLAWVSGTPATDDIGKSVLSPSRARVVFDRIDAFENPRDAAAITRALRQRLACMSGWPLNDSPMPSPMPLPHSPAPSSATMPA